MVVGLMILIGYASYTAYVAVQGLIRQGGPAHRSGTRDFFAEKPGHASALADIETEETGRYIEGFINDLEQSRSIERDMRSMLERNLPAQAIARLQSAPESVPKTALMISMLAEAQMLDRDYSAAIETLLQVLSAEPDQSEYRLLLSEALYHSEKFSAALAAAQWTLIIDGNSAAARSVMADSYSSLGMYEQSIPQLRRILDDNPGDDSARNRLALAYYEGGEYARAVRLLEDMIARDTDNSLAYYNLAICYARQGISDQVVRTLVRARRRFGDSIVRSWIQGSEFDDLRNRADFILFTNELERGPEVSRVRDASEGRGQRAIEIGTAPLQFEDRTEGLLNRQR